MDSNEPFTLSWEEMVAIYEMLLEWADTPEEYNLFSRLHAEINPRVPTEAPLV